MSGLANGGLYAILLYLAVVLDRAGASSSSATTRSSGERSPAAAPAAGSPALDPAFVADATVTATDVSVWFGQKVALSELSCSFGPGSRGCSAPTGPARPR